MKRLGKTPPFLGPRGEPIPGSIAEINYLRLGGLDQWVMIRGESVANPPLLLLHGGPGFTEMRLFRHFNAPLEWTALRFRNARLARSRDCAAAQLK